MSEQGGVWRGLNPYDLTPPARLLNQHPHKRPGYHAHEIKIGGGVDMATLTIATWKACPPGCTVPVASHDAGRSVYLKVRCDAMPHCGSCECGDGHGFTVSEDQAAALLAALS